MSDELHIPEPKIELALPAVRIPEIITRPISLPAPVATEEKSMIERIKAVWTIVSAVVGELIVAAEFMAEHPNGAARKEYVVREVRRWLDVLADNTDLLPAPVEKLVLGAVSYFLPAMVERVFREMDRAGMVNVKG